MRKINNHPNLVKMIEHFETPKEIYIVQEYVSGVSLYHYLKAKN